MNSLQAATAALDALLDAAEIPKADIEIGRTLELSPSRARLDVDFTWREQTIHVGLPTTVQKDLHFTFNGVHWTLPLARAVEVLRTRFMLGVCREVHPDDDAYSTAHADQPMFLEEYKVAHLRSCAVCRACLRARLDAMEPEK